MQEHFSSVPNKYAPLQCNEKTILFFFFLSFKTLQLNVNETDTHHGPIRSDEFQRG